MQAVRDFINAMHLRETADYEADFSESGAVAVIASAEIFLKKVNSLLGIGLRTVASSSPFVEPTLVPVIHW